MAVTTQKKRRATAVRHQGSPQAYLQTEYPYEYRRYSTVGFMLVFIRGGDSDDVEQIFQMSCVGFANTLANI